MNFKALASEIIADFGDAFDFDRLNDGDRRKLCAAYLREHPESIEDALAGVNERAIANYVATLIEPLDRCAALERTDVLDLAVEIREGAFPNKALISLVEGELDHVARRMRVEGSTLRPIGEVAQEAIKSLRPAD